MMIMVLSAGWAYAVPSACTALWGTSGSNLVYYNSATNQWMNAATTPVVGNSLSAFEGDGALYFTDGVTVGSPSTIQLYKATLSNNPGTITFSSMGAISVPSSFTFSNSTNVIGTLAINFIVGATFDRDTSTRRMFLLGSENNSNPSIYVDSGGITTTSEFMLLGLVNPENPVTSTWVPIHTSIVGSTVTYPFLASSGDIFADQATGTVWLISNTNPVRMIKLALNYSGYNITSAQSVQTATLGTLNQGVNSVAVHPRTGLVYVAGTAPVATQELVDHTAAPTIAFTTVETATSLTDAGNCVAPPDPPAVTKSFNPTIATTPGTSTLNIVISNPNKVPIYVTLPMTDTLPAGLRVHTTPSLSGTCFSEGTALASLPAGTTITGAAGAANVIVSSGGLIPGGINGGGSCSFSVRVSATVANLYSNSIPADGLVTSSGNNAVAAVATFQVQNPSLPNLPIVTKSFNPVTSTSATGTSTLTIVISNPNTSSNTLTSSLTDTLPAGLGITRPSRIAINCFSDGVAVAKPASTTATTATTRITIVSGSVIPGGTVGGSCSFVVRTTATVAGIYANTIPAGDLKTVSGSNVDPTTATFFLRASDFSVVKSQAIGAAGATTTGNIDIASGATISYVINIRNGGGVAGTRTFTDTLPVLITPVLSITAVGVGGAGCTTATSVLAGQTRLRGTVTNATIDAGCDITIVARGSTTAAISVATNSVGIYTVTGALDTITANNTSTVVLTIKPAANLTITKNDGVTTFQPGATNNYTITVANLGPSAADGATLKDPLATGLNCTSITCSATGGASCPLPIQLFVSALQSATGIAIPVFPSGSSATFVLSCAVTATGLP